MRLPAATLAVFSMATPAEAEQRPVPERVAPAIVHEITPALGDYTDAVLFGDVWKRTELAPRDRSVVTLAALVAGGHTAQMRGHLNRGLDNGVKPAEIAAMITHLAFYAGWPRAMSAVGVAKEVFMARNIAPELIASEPGEPVAIDQEVEAKRAAAVAVAAGDTAPALVQYTNGTLFGDLWRRADLAPRDRSLVTIVVLIAGGQDEQLPFHLNRGMDNGLTRTELSEVITHLAFYAGWPLAMSALPVTKTVFEARNPGSSSQSAAAPQASGQSGATAPEKAPLDILRYGSQPATAGASEYFTGTVRVEQRFQRAAPARVGGGIVTFEPGARTVWHTHPLGQTLIVTAGCGWVQREGNGVEEIRPGDVVWIPPGERHWHGATPTSGMAHVAIAEALDGKSVDWMERVSDAQYAGGPRSAGGC